MINTDDNKWRQLNERLNEHDHRIIEQEHRLTSIVKNIYRYAVDEPDQAKLIAAGKSLLSCVLRRQTAVLLVSLGAGLISLSSLVVAYQTMELLKDQNIKIEQQNKLFVQQNQLVEADRRSSLVFLFNNIMDAIDNEFKNPPRVSLRVRKIPILDTDRQFAEDNEDDVEPTNYDESTQPRGNLSQSLVGRIISLSRRLKPYRYFNYEDSTMSSLTSPERGQLLVNLYTSGLDAVTLSVISRLGDFSYADLSGINLSDKASHFYMEEANLQNADLSEAHIDNVTFNGVNLKNALLDDATLHNEVYFYLAEFEGANMKNVRIGNGKVYESNFKNTKLENSKWESLHIFASNFYFSDMSNASFTNSYLALSYMYQSKLTKSNFSNDTLAGAFFKQCNLEGANFTESWISGSDFSGSNLKYSNFRGSIIEGGNFDNTDLTGAWLLGADLSGILSSRNIKLDSAFIEATPSNSKTVLNKRALLKKMTEKYVIDSSLHSKQIHKNILMIDSLYSVRYVKYNRRGYSGSYQLLPYPQ